MKSNGNFDIDINYYTAEMPVEELIAEFHCNWLLREKKILVSIDDIYSFGDKKISDKVNSILESKECQDITNTFEKKVRIVAENFGFKYIYSQIQKTANKHGIIEYEDSNNNDGKERFVKSYKEHNENMFCINILDNFQKLQVGKDDLSTKDCIDKTSKSIDYARQKFKQTWIALSQVNRTTKNFDRYKLENFFPGPESMKDSEGPFHDCQVCITAISPLALDLSDFHGYKVHNNVDSKGLMDRFRPIRIIKNRGGRGYCTGYLGFLGEAAFFWELPDKMNFGDYNKLDETINNYK